jgi:hypothetical protein
LAFTPQKTIYLIEDNPKKYLQLKALPRSLSISRMAFTPQRQHISKKAIQKISTIESPIQVLVHQPVGLHTPKTTYFIEGNPKNL